MAHQAIDPSDASAVLAHLRQVQRRASSRLPGMWFPLLLFGALSLLSIPVVVWLGLGWYNLFWGVAGPTGGLLTALFYALAGRRIGLEVPAVPYLVALVVIVAGAAVAGAVGGIIDEPRLSVAGPPLAVAAGLLLIARQTRSVALVWLAGIVGAVDIGLLAASSAPTLIAVTVGFAYGVPALVVGLGVVWRKRRR